MSSRLMPLAGHFHELRKALLVSGLAIFAAAITVYALWADMLFVFFTQTVQELEIPIIAIRVAELFIAKMKISFLGGFIVAFPVVLWQLWSFFAPALNKKERRWAYVLIPAAIILFGLGIVFSYFTVFPLTVQFLLFAGGGHYAPMLTIKEYLSFTLAFFIPMGLAFQLPLVVLVLGKLRLIRVEFLVQMRKYALLIIVILAAVLTGPDVLSQVMMAGPVYLLYEASVLLLKISRYLSCRKARKKQSEMPGLGCSG